MISPKVAAMFAESQVMMLIEEYNSQNRHIFEFISSLNAKNDSVKSELKEDIAILDCKIMGISKRVDTDGEETYGGNCRGAC